MTLLVDADFFFYTISYRYRNTDPTEGELLLDCVMDLRSMCAAAKATNYVFALSSRTNFRDKVYQVRTYKGKRGPAADYVQHFKPILTKLFLEDLGAVVLDGLEADDIVAALHTLHPDTTTLYSKDKDLKQIPGIHLNTDLQLVPVSEQDALQYFATQLLMGDTTDNIAGLPKIGKVKAKQLVANMGSPLDLEKIETSSTKLYLDAFQETGESVLQQTWDTVQMLTPQHRLWSEFEPFLNKPLTSYEGTYQLDSAQIPEFEDDPFDEARKLLY